MMQSWDQFPTAPRAPSQPVIPRTPAPQTAAQQEHEALTNESLRQTIEQNNQRLDPQAIDLFAHQYLANGLIPAFGMGRAGAANRNAVLNRIGEIVGTRGGTGEQMAVAISRYRNGAHALQTLENQLGTISGNEQSARGYADQALSALRNVAPDNSWSPTNWVRNLVGDTTNNPALGAWDSARNTFLTEYGKVVAGSPSGAGVLSDSARQEQMAVLRRTTNPQQAESIIHQMQNDMEIRLHALQANIQHGYRNLEAGQPISFSPQGDMLDEHGNIQSQRRDDSQGGTMPLLGAQDNGAAMPGMTPPSGTPPAAPPSGPSGGPQERLDPTRRTAFNPQESVELATSGTTNQDEGGISMATLGVNRHVATMVADRSIPDEQIRLYAQRSGASLPNLESVLAYRHTRDFETWRSQHPGEAYPLSPPRQDRPMTTGESVANYMSDTPYGAATVNFGNFIAGQQLPEMTANPDRTRAAIDEINQRHPYAAIAGNVAGGASLYYGGARLAEAGAAGLARAAPTVAERFPWLVRAAGTADDAAAGANPYSAATVPTPHPTFGPGAIAGDAAIGAYESPGDRVGGAVLGAATGVGARGVINTAGRAVSPTGGALAPAYEEGVAPSLGQRVGGVANRVEQTFQSIPFVGGVQRATRNRALDQWQLGGFNRALRNLPDEVQLPAGTEPGTAPHAFAQDAFDRAYDRVHQRINVVPDDQLEKDLADISQNANSLLPDASVSHFNRIMDNSVLRRLTDPRSAQAGLSGDELQQALSEIRRAARGLRSNPAGDRELASTLDDVSQAIYDNAARHSPTEAIQTLGNINRGYGMLVRIENAANRAGQGDPGEFTARSLMNAERQQGGLRGRQFLAGDGLLTDYARAGLRLGQTVPDSGTFERLATVGSMAAGTHYVSPLTAIPWAVDTVTNLPVARDVVNWTLRPNRPSIRPLTDELRSQIQARSYLGSALGAPGVVALYGNSP